MPTSVAILSSASGGGAGIAAKRLCNGLNSTDEFQADFIDVKLLGESIPPSVCLPGNLSNHKFTNTHFTAEHPGFVRGWVVDLLSKYDLVNVHWASYLVSVSELAELARRGTNILFTMHDFYYSTGGCHYPAGCTGQTLSCRTCPQVNDSKFDHVGVATAFRTKKNFFNLPNVHVSAPSAFLIDSVVRAGLVPLNRSHVIRNIYQPLSTGFSTKQQTKHNLLLIADSLAEKRKGMDLALAALTQVSQQIPNGFSIHIIGSASDEFKTSCRKRGLTPTFHGRIEEHKKLVELYRDVGLILSCSYEDNWPNILVEAGAYGVIPVVGSGHGCEEFCHQFSIGHVVDGYTPGQFADAICDQIDAFPSDDAISAFTAAVRDAHKTTAVVDTYKHAITIMNGEATNSRDISGSQTSRSLSENYQLPVSRPAGRQTVMELVSSGPFSDEAVNFSKYGLRVKRETPTE